MTMKLEAEEAEDWQYRGEGAANVVLSYHGSNPALVGKVLRIRKVSPQFHSNGSTEVPSKAAVAEEDAECHERPRDSLLSVEEKILWADWQEVIAATTTAELAHAYARNIMCPLIGSEFVDPGVLVSVSGSFVEILNRNITTHRPAWRTRTGTLHVTNGLALLINDHTILQVPSGILRQKPPTLSVELKPKCGFLPIISGISKQNMVKEQVSRFTMHQHLKLSQGKIREISGYSPLDLFSETREGILQAVQALFRSPQNNLRVFMDGEEVYGAVAGKENLDIDRLDDRLRSFMPHVKEQLVGSLQGLVADSLLNSEICSRLLAVQKLDFLDIKGTFEVYLRFLDYVQHSRSNCPKKENKLCNSSKTAREQLSEMLAKDRDGRDMSAMWELGSMDHDKFVLCSFLIAATAKDCGMMLTFLPIDNVDGFASSKHTIVSSGQCYFYKIALVDLDIKPLRKMPYYIKLDQDVWSAYLSSC